MNQPGDKQWICDVCGKIGESEIDIKRKYFKQYNVPDEKIMFLHEDCWNKLKELEEYKRIQRHAHGEI
jgi:hypothetical protein